MLTKPLAVAMAEDVRCVLRVQATTGGTPIWSEQEARLYWIDVQEPALHRFDPATGQDEHWELPAWIGCYALGTQGRVLVALRTGLAWLDLAAGMLTHAAASPCDRAASSSMTAAPIRRDASGSAPCTSPMRG